MEEKVRRLVRQVVDEVLGAGNAPGAGVAGAPAAPASGPSTSGEGSSRVAGSAKTIAVGADHGGFALKEKLIAKLRTEGYGVLDCGTFSTQSCDYPDFAFEVARKVAEGACRWGVIVDGAGIGSAMVANKVPGVRAALAYDISSARNSREHNHANVLTLGAGLIGEGLALQILEAWLQTPWGEGRHARRVEKITAVEGRFLRP
jgi:ribose 5-phosphate isomerase B